MSDHNYILAYSVQNQAMADHIASLLGQSGVLFEHVTDVSTNGRLWESLKEQQKLAFVLISDNFLKSTECLTGSIPNFQELLNFNLIQPIIIDGQYPIAGANQVETVPTVFQRVGQVINYMNFWQDQYRPEDKVS